MCIYITCFDETKYISFLIEDHELLKAYNKAQNKVSNLIQKGFDSKSMNNEEYLKTKINFTMAKYIKIFMLLAFLEIVLTVFVKIVKVCQNKLKLNIWQRL